MPGLEILFVMDPLEALILETETSLLLTGQGDVLEPDDGLIGIGSGGTFALAAQSGLRGAEIWVDDVNSRGGIPIGGAKRKVELVKLDDRSDKTVIPKVYETLIKDEKVDLCFGPFGSTLTAAAVGDWASIGRARSSNVSIGSESVAAALGRHTIGG